MTDIQFDKQDQLAKIQAGLMPGEALFAVYDGKGTGTGFIGLTDLRVIYPGQLVRRREDRPHEPALQADPERLVCVRQVDVR